MKVNPRVVLHWQTRYVKFHVLFTGRNVTWLGYIFPYEFWLPGFLWTSRSWLIHYIAYCREFIFHCMYFCFGGASCSNLCWKISRTWFISFLFWKLVFPHTDNNPVFNVIIALSFVAQFILASKENEIRFCSHFCKDDNVLLPQIRAFLPNCIMPVPFGVNFSYHLI